MIASALRRLNLGAADRDFPGFLSVDITPPADFIADLSQPWPWPDSSVEEILAYDIIEHIGDCNHVSSICGLCRRAGSGDILSDFGRLGEKGRHWRGSIHFMNELHRVLTPGGIARIETPNAARGAGFFQDPTHVSPWCLNSFQYFEQGRYAVTRLAKSYGITARFKILELGEKPYQDVCEQVWKITAVIEAVK